MKPRPLFKNPEYQEQIDAKGFVTLPFIGEKELEELRSFYHEIHPDGAPGKIDGIHMKCVLPIAWLKFIENLAKMFFRTIAP